VTSPAVCLRETAEATARLVRRALAAGASHVLVDTSGLVEGRFGVALKRLKIERVAPDVLLVLQAREECEPILRALPAAAAPAVVRLPAAVTAPRSAVARRRAREEALAAHLAGARPVTLDLARVPARLALPRRGLSVLDAAGALVGLDDREGRTLGLGWISAIDTATAQVTVQTRVDASRIAALAIGRERYRAA
jgi:polynucleotide 5'-kinase involved in rRNA processing